MITKPLLVKCRGGCGRKADLSYQRRIGARLGFKRTPSYQCHECYIKEQASLSEGTMTTSHPAPLDEQVFRRFQRWTLKMDEVGAQAFWNDIEWLRGIANAAPPSDKDAPPSCVNRSGCETPNDCRQHGYCRSPHNKAAAPLQENKLTWDNSAPGYVRGLEEALRANDNWYELGHDSSHGAIRALLQAAQSAAPSEGSCYDPDETRPSDYYDHLNTAAQSAAQINAAPQEATAEASSELDREAGPVMQSGGSQPHPVPHQGSQNGPAVAAPSAPCVVGTPVEVGWQCPGCKRCYAPGKWQCDYCLPSLKDRIRSG